MGSSGSRSSAGGSASVRSAAAARVADRYAAAPSYRDLFGMEIAPCAATLAALNEEQTLLPAKAAEDSQDRKDGAIAMPVAIPEFSEMSAEQQLKRGMEIATAPSNGSHHPVREALDREAHRAAEAECSLAVVLHGGEFPWQHAAVPNPVQESHIWHAALESREEADAVATVHPQPIPGNVIEFPVEVVAARKMRPRRAEGIYAAMRDAEPQLSIFEVDPAAVSDHAEAPEVSREPANGTLPEWAGMQLKANHPPEAAGQPLEEACRSQAIPLQAAPINRRLLAAVFDVVLISILFLAAASLAVAKAAALPALREAEIEGAWMFAAVAVAYLAMSFLLARATPGMRYALISLRTFEGLTPTREQRCRRLGAFALSMLPVGLGAVWALFDEEHLCWHDRWSGTYLKQVY